MVGVPTSIMYQLENGALKTTPRYGTGSDDPLPLDYALFYRKKVGRINTEDMMIKIYTFRDGKQQEIKEFYSTKYGNDFPFLKKIVENYILTQLTMPKNPQQNLSNYRKGKKSRPKPKRKCKCKK